MLLHEYSRYRGSQFTDNTKILQLLDNLCNAIITMEQLQPGYCDSNSREIKLLSISNNRSLQRLICWWGARGTTTCQLQDVELTTANKSTV